MKRTLSMKMTLLGGAAALALGAAACEVEDPEGVEEELPEDDLLEDEDL